MTPLLLGCIADDFTGGTDLASTLVRGGMRTLQVIGIPEDPIPDDVDAVVIALKTRTLPAQEAVRQSLEALDYLKKSGCRQYFFKYCSTFDSTAKGNIGPVADALMDALDIDFAIACPAFPENKRTVYQGHLFVGDTLLSESGMRNHPLTPMTDSNLVRVLQQQTPKKVGLVPHSAVAKGNGSLKKTLSQVKEAGCSYAIVDAISDEDLRAISVVIQDHVLVTGGSGIALGLPDNFGRKGLLVGGAAASELPAVGGLSAVLSGSCSVATNAQVAHWQATRPSFRLDPLALSQGEDQVAQALEWATPLIKDQPVLIYGSAEPESVKAVQQRLGVEAAGQIMEDALSQIAKGLVDLGVRKLVVAGGETSGAVVNALDVEALRIGAPIDPGVPWTVGLRDQPVALALKSGNFGTVDFFEKALECVR